VLVALARLPSVSPGFFLTGGTALAVFYLHHRVSRDLDLFTRGAFEPGALAFQARSLWPGDFSLTQESESFVSFLAKGVRVDLVRDPLSRDVDRVRVPLAPKVDLAVDGIEDIAANKLCTVASRREPKDFVDLYAILTKCPSLSLDALYDGARKKEALFDDPATVAYQIEENFRAVTSAPELLPDLRTPIDQQAWARFYEKLCSDIYARLRR